TIERTPKTQIDAMNLQTRNDRLVLVEDVIDGFDDPGVVAKTVVIQHLVDNQLSARGNALERVVLACVRTGDDAAHVRSMTIAIRGGWIARASVGGLIEFHGHIGMLRTVPHLGDVVVSAEMR